jgi:hypothetical protein
MALQVKNVVRCQNVQPLAEPAVIASHRLVINGRISCTHSRVVTLMDYRRLGNSSWLRPLISTETD